MIKIKNMVKKMDKILDKMDENFVDNYEDLMKYKNNFNNILHKLGFIGYDSYNNFCIDIRNVAKNRIIKEKVIECYYPTPEERVSHFKKFWDTAAIVWVHIRLLPLKFILKRLPSNR